MLSKNKLKFIRSLDTKKSRNENGVFLAEGNKLVSDLLPYFTCECIVATADWIKQHSQAIDSSIDIIEATRDELSRASLLKSPQQILAIFRQRESTFNITDVCNELSIALDGVQDPGNLGTIIRVADWFGIRHLFCSHDTADVYNPKVVQATMGALARVQVHTTDLVNLLQSWPVGSPKYGTFLDGNNIYTRPLQNKGLIIMGNEGKGISADVAACIDERLYIPNYPAGEITSESLNVAMATGILCAEFRRRLC